MLTFHSLVDDAGTFKLSVLHCALSQQWPLQISILLGTTLCHPPPFPPHPRPLLTLNDANLSASLNSCDFCQQSLHTAPSLLPCFPGRWKVPAPGQVLPTLLQLHQWPLF